MEPKQIYEPLDLLRNSAANISSPNLQIPPLQTCYPREEEKSIQGDKFPNEPKVKCVTIFSIFFLLEVKIITFSIQDLFLTFSQQPVSLSLGKKKPRTADNY